MKRIKLKNEGFGPAHMAKSQPIGIAEDNLVCAVCGEKLRPDGEWTIVSNQRRKGIIVLAHLDHISGAMNLIAKLLDIKPVQEGLRLPSESDN